MAALLAAGALAALAAAPNWPFAVLAAGAVGLGASVLAPLCLASAARLSPTASEAVLARLNLFNHVGVVTGGALSGLLGSTGHFRLAYAVPAALLVLVPASARHLPGLRARPEGRASPERPEAAIEAPPRHRGGASAQGGPAAQGWGPGHQLVCEDTADE
ncbi:MFS transporter [Streptomyces sp. NPDC005476]|uniref:MFS transporter n=1 Tax=Streptomyces sp. NPDC005476 TaxID=3156882 RepID=UPI0034514782